jgi:hypothetical protein
MKPVILLLAVICCAAACRPGTDTPVPIPNTLLARWTLTRIQSAGTGSVGEWRNADSAGQWIQFTQGGQISGTVFPQAMAWQLRDSVTVEISDASQSGGIRLFNFQIDTTARKLYLFIKPPNGMLCIEGCGGYELER